MLDLVLVGVSSLPSFQLLASMPHRTGLGVSPDTMYRPVNSMLSGAGPICSQWRCHALFKLQCLVYATYPSTACDCSIR